MRMFVGVWPSPEVRDRLAELDRPPVPGLRWTTSDQWHVTLAFLGNVPDGEGATLVEALTDVARQFPIRPTATAGPATTTLADGLLCLPVDGLDVVAHAVRASLLGQYGEAGQYGELGRYGEAAVPPSGGQVTPAPFRGHPTRSPFRGHLTLARARRGRRVPAALCGVPLEVRWSVDRICLVSSTLDPGGARYETLAARPFSRAEPTTS